VILIDPEVNIDLLTTIFGKIYQKIPSTKLSPLKKKQELQQSDNKKSTKKKRIL